MSSNKEKIGKIIEEYRKNSGLSRSQLAEKVGVSRQMVYDWETGKSEPSITRFGKIAEILDINLNIIKDSFEEDIGEDDEIESLMLMRAKMTLMEKKLQKAFAKVDIDFAGV